MLKIRKFAAIDIGSNAIRLLINNVIEFPDHSPTQFNKNALVRVPERLGEDSFTVGEISKQNASRIIDTMKSFKLLMRVHGVEQYMACATSAMREANNGNELVEIIKQKAGIAIEIIDGKKEAAIIASTDRYSLLDKEKTYLYVDVGSCSTEFTIFDQGKIVESKSSKVGTVRLLNEMIGKQTWSEIEKWITKASKKYKKIDIIGSGGNINKLFKMSASKPGEP